MGRLLDRYGNPVRVAALEQPRAEPGVTGIRQAFASTVASGLTPERLAGILRACDLGDLTDYLVLAQEMEERDPHYFAVMGTRKRAVSGIAPRVIPAGEDTPSKTIAAAVEARIAEHEGFSDLVEALLDAIGKGFSLVEIDWRRTGAQWWPEDFIHVDPRFVTFDRETGRELRLVDEADPVDGIALEPFRFMRHVARMKSGLAFRGGIARVAAFGWMCKAYGLKDWVAFVETYGLPLRLGRYDAGATKDDVAALYRAVANIGTDAAAVLPRSMEIDFTDTKATGGDRVFENLARYVDEQVSKAVLGQTMTSDDGSSMAQAQVHNEVRHDIASADARAVGNTINRDLVRPFVDLNFGVQKAYPRLVIEIEEAEDTEMVIRNVDRLAKLGLTFKASELRARLKFTEPEQGDEVIGGATAPAAPPPAEREARNRPEMPGAPWDDLDALEEEMLDDWRPAIGPMADPLIGAIDGAGSYEEALERLEAARGEMSEAALIEALVIGMTRARGIGDRSDG
ncbi:DUF935 domain-containing protein [Profundibacterium mesophilum]|uniref:DUF935 domain-containing protein n=1 Tax=Profundibacterium mesophilum KAUST100406-0324 TaxID=1037889 RepID=A0A921NQV2_9RHOB|nr:DUF935 domain-containing protein [Profundibacterium mesophilum]KAF0676747.1 hypothetical protein PMES_00934 [Profundibacterium mesophilum KAUST100406-0324]